jgi:hypothetical protein
MIRPGDIVVLQHQYHHEPVWPAPDHVLLHPSGTARIDVPYLVAGSVRAPLNEGACDWLFIVGGEAMGWKPVRYFAKVTTP